MMLNWINRLNLLKELVIVQAVEKWLRWPLSVKQWQKILRKLFVCNQLCHPERDLLVQANKIPDIVQWNRSNVEGCFMGKQACYNSINIFNEFERKLIWLQSPSYFCFFYVFERFVVYWNASKILLGISLILGMLPLCFAGQSPERASAVLKSNEVVSSQNLSDKSLPNVHVRSEDSNLQVTAKNLPEIFSTFSPCCVRIRYKMSGKTQFASGFFVSDRGHVLISILGGKDFMIETSSNLFPAKILGEDPVTSLCLLKADLGKVKKVPFFPLTHTFDGPRIGQSVISLSCKLGQAVSPQKGYITSFSDRYFDREFPFVFVRSSLRLDAGDCGGAVLDTAGNLMGMLLHALPDTQETFYMPVRGLERIFQDLLLYGRVRYAYAGLSTQAVYDKEESVTRLQVMEVQPGSPAEKSGFLKKDILLKLNGEVVRSIENFKNFIFLSKPNDYLNFTVMRGKKMLSLPLRMGEKSNLLAK